MKEPRPIRQTYVRRDGHRQRIVKKNPQRDAYLELHRCSECGEMFLAAKSNAVTCCDTHRKRRSRRIRRELAQVEAGQLAIPMMA
jgi:hypothetical protein